MNTWTGVSYKGRLHSSENKPTIDTHNKDKSQKSHNRHDEQNPDAEKNIMYEFKKRQK